MEQHREPTQSTKRPRIGRDILGPAVRRGALLALSVAAMAAAGCNRRNDADVSTGWTPKRGDAVMGVPTANVTTAIQTQLAAQPATALAGRWKHVQRLYTTYGNAPLWIEPDGFNEPRSKALLRAIVDANTDALRLDAYPLDELVAAVGAVQKTKNPTAEQLATADVLLTSAYVALAEDLLGGQVDPKSLAQDWHIATNREPVDSAVARSLRDARLDSAIARMRPQGTDYEALRRALVRFRGIVANGGWPTVPTGKALKPGQSDAAARIAALRERLRIEGFGAATGDVAGNTTTNALANATPTATPSATPNAQPNAGATRTASTAPGGTAVYDAALAGLVAAFQARHGIAVDSMLGEETVQSLNVPAQYRLAQLAANLERYRWMPRSFGGRYILVNVPAFRLEAHDTSGSTLEMKVIVGEEYEGRKTPAFADSMETVVFRPYWFITPDIQAEETEPKIAANAGYMEANDLEYYEDGSATRIRQKPGPKNSLGLVKFLFPNNFNIYLHDTPQDDLFDEDVRAFSHGCIRLEKPAELAQWVLGWDAAKVNEAMQRGEDDQSIKLPRKIPVYIVYATAFERDGQLYFGNDLYNRDDALVQAVSQNVAPDADALRRLDALRKLVED